ncbi:MAG TPA: hypothetical protein VF800_02160 [Telluria sp.]
MNIFSAGIAAALVTAGLLASTPAAATVIYYSNLYTADGGGKAYVEWYWTNSGRRTTYIKIWDTRCDGFSPKLHFYRTWTSSTKAAVKGCGTYNYYFDQLDAAL